MCFLEVLDTCDKYIYLSQLGLCQSRSVRNNYGDVFPSNRHERAEEEEVTSRSQ